RSVLIPGLVNAHTHLDLTHIGPRPFDPEAGFVGWVNAVRQGRHLEEAEVAASGRRGGEVWAGGGGGGGGGVAGGGAGGGGARGAPQGRPTLAPFRALADSPLAGVSFVEFFGIGNRLAASRERMEGLLSDWPLGGRVRAGLQPHAPNTVDLSLYLR